MDNPNPRGQLPSIAVSVQTAWKEYIQHMAVVLLEPPLGRRHSPGNVERFGDHRREAFYQYARHESDEHEVYVGVERANPWTKGFVVEPSGILKIIEEIAQRLRRRAQHLILLLYAGLDEPVQFVRRQRGEFLHHRVKLGVAYGGVLDVVVDQRLIVAAGVGIGFRVCCRYLYHFPASPSVGRQAVQDTLHLGGYGFISSREL